jgi:hypothetical protein
MPRPGRKGPTFSIYRDVDRKRKNFFSTGRRDVLTEGDISPTEVPQSLRVAPDDPTRRGHFLTVVPHDVRRRFQRLTGLDNFLAKGSHAVRGLSLDLTMGFIRLRRGIFRLAPVAVSAAPGFFPGAARVPFFRLAPGADFGCAELFRARAR